MQSSNGSFFSPDALPYKAHPRPHGRSIHLFRTNEGVKALRMGTCPLPEISRELLRSLDTPCSIDQWVRAVDGACLADGIVLISSRLVDAAVVPGGPTQGSADAGVQPLMHRLLALSAERLYSLLTQQAKRRLGLIKGFQMILALERCTAYREQQALAVWLVDEVYRLHGELGLKPLGEACRLASDEA